MLAKADSTRRASLIGNQGCSAPTGAYDKTEFDAKDGRLRQRFLQTPELRLVSSCT